MPVPLEGGKEEIQVVFIQLVILRFEIEKNLLWGRRGACQFRFQAIDTLHRDCIILDRRKGGKGIELGLEIDDDAVFSSVGFTVIEPVIGFFCTIPVGKGRLPYKITGGMHEST